MLKQMMPALRATIVLAVFTGIIFPVVVTALAQFLFPGQSSGSLIRNSTGQVIGSTVIGQQFVSARYFHSRPSAAGSGYGGEASSGTNLGPTSLKLILGNANTKDANGSFAGIKQLAEEYRKQNHLSSNEKVPVDAVTRSGSGLDPHISQTNAMFQARRVASACKMSLAEVQTLIQSHTEPRQFGLLGEPRVNVLMLNIALDEMKQK